MISRGAKGESGFTLLEILVVISIIGFISSLILPSINNARDRARAVRFVSDFNSITKALFLWQSDANIPFVHEDVYGSVNSGAPCHDEPVLSETDLFQDQSGSPGWKGPYMAAVPRDPFGREYSYDNDGDVWNPPGQKWGGVNIQAQWCVGEGARYLRLAPLIDALYDHGDGANLGRFKWDTSEPGGYGILIAPSFSQ